MLKKYLMHIANDQFSFFEKYLSTKDAKKHDPRNDVRNLMKNHMQKALFS